jgi:hypothetical protein
VSAERELLRRLQDTLAAADIDAADLVESAWAEAREEVQTTLRHLMVRDLLGRCLGVLTGDATVGRSPTAPPQQRPTARRATYLFGVAGDDLDLPDEELPSIPASGPLRIVGRAGLRAVVCDVDVATFEALNDPDPDALDTLAAAARAHDTILATIATSGPVLPLPLGTVVADDAQVEEVLGRHADRLHAELERVAGHAEWAVTVHLFDDGEAVGDGAQAPVTSGRDYLEARRAALDARARRWHARDDLVAAIHDTLAACAVDAQRVQRRPLEDIAPPLLHGVYLLADEDRDRFAATVEDLRSEHHDAVIDVGGPWPPYHFTKVDLAEDGEVQ